MPASKQKSIDRIFTRGEHKNLDVFLLHPSYFDLPKRSFKNNSEQNIIYKKPSKDIDCSSRGNAGFIMRYDELKGLFRPAWKDENYDYLDLDRFTEKHEVKNYNCNEYRPGT